MTDRLIHIGGYSCELVTIECARPGDRYTLFDSPPELDVHLAGPSPSGGIGPIICGFDRFAAKVGFSVGGGSTGPGINHHACPVCAEKIEGRSVGGTHKGLFEKWWRHHD